MAEPALTREEFTERWCAASGMTEKEMSRFFVVLPCACNAPTCKGWAMVSNEPRAIKAHNDLYAPKDGTDTTK